VSGDRTRVLIVDDSFVVRAGLRDFVTAQPDFAVVAEASNGREAVEAAREHRPDVVLMDLRMRAGDGITATREIVRELPETKVLVLTWLEDPASLRNAVYAGAKGYLVHGSFASDELAHALRVLTDEGALITPVLAGELLRSMDAGEAPAGDPAEQLTPRERQILSLVQRGRTNREIAQALGIEEKTVKNHINSLYSKLAISSRLEAMASFKRERAT
jgi:DNA-binding NarL/FixJ family response regulator